MSFDTQIVWQNLPSLLYGLRLTIVIVILSLFFAGVIGVLICAGMLLGSPVVRRISADYVSIFRALPEPIIIFWLYYCSPLILNTKLTAFETGAIALAIPSGAYLAEIFRAGIQAIPRGQIEAARALGLPPFWLLWDVLVPQALRIMIPPTLGIVTILIKNSALVSALGVEELFYRANVLGGQTFHYFEFLTVTAIIYFMLILPLSAAVQFQEQRLSARHR
ncbi:MAG: ABC transporter, permease protein (cluster 3, basic aa/glutamine/opines) [Pseudolabrys sp.]|jgi:His/Glu/Gln/Arg/opine family amino acid ABC transporter permease subunit|nr:ABC transporter, permease protein (cluster 3, basic aa/glutamine/opines) [Pseudolabrys sp.]